MEETNSIVLGGGCFWCLEAIFQRVKGVKTVTNGYAGGEVDNPNYENVCGGATGHAEVVKIEFNPEKLSLKTILQIFWATHDPTTLNQQGADIGTQYRSAIFYCSDEQKQIIQKSLVEDGQPLWKDKIMTEISSLAVFWPAEDYHQDYFNKHPAQGYCLVVINPKVAKLKKKFAHLLKD